MRKKKGRPVLKENTWLYRAYPSPNSSETVSLGNFIFRNSQWAKTLLEERKCIYIRKILETKGCTQQKKDLVNIYTFVFSKEYFNEKKRLIKLWINSYKGIEKKKVRTVSLFGFIRCLDIYSRYNFTQDHTKSKFLPKIFSWTTPDPEALLSENAVLLPASCFILHQKYSNWKPTDFSQNAVLLIINTYTGNCFHSYYLIVFHASLTTPPKLLFRNKLIFLLINLRGEWNFIKDNRTFFLLPRMR